MPKKKITTRIKESSWQTTAAGIMALLGTAASIYGTAANKPEIAAMGSQAATVFGAGGLLFAKDAGK